MHRDHSFIASTVLSLHKRSDFSPSICAFTWRRSVPSRTIRFAASELTSKLEDIATSGTIPSNPADENSQRNGEKALSDSDGLSEQRLSGQIEDITLLSDLTDENFLNALSKGWDDLAQFDPNNVPPEPEEQVSVDSSNETVGAVQSVETKPDIESVAQEVETLAKKETKKRGRKPKKKSLSEKAESEEKPKAQKRTKKAASQKEPVIDPEELSEEENELKSTPRWYFVQVKPSCENNVATSIRNLTHSIEGDEIIDVLVPMTKTLKLSKGGASTEKDERYFPGYILVLMRMDRISYGHLKRVPHVQGFMGDPNDAVMNKDQPFRPPMPVSDTEMKAIFEKIRDVNVRARQAETGFHLNDVIRVVSGSMEGTKGRVVEVKPDLDIINCKLMLFGRETLVELNTSQVELYDEEKARLEERQNRRADNAIQNKRSDSKRRRVESSFGKVGKVDYSNANVSSAADDLAQLLLDDDDGDSWDPLASAEGKSKKKLPFGQRSYRNEYDVGEFDPDDSQAGDGFQDVSFIDDDNEGGEADISEGSVSAGKNRPDEVLDEIDFGAQDSGGNSDGLVTSDDELDEFLRMENDEDTRGPKHRNTRFKSTSSRADPKDSDASKSLEIDPELKMVLDEIDQELSQEESRSGGKKRLGRKAAERNSGVDFMEDESDTEESEGNWLLDSVEFPFDIEAAEKEAPSEAADDSVGSSRSKKAKKKNKGQELDPSSGEILYSEFEKEFLTDLDDVGDEVVRLNSTEDVAEFDLSMLEEPKSDEEIVEEFKAKRKPKGRTPTTGKRGRKRPSASS